jgi:hypothetical protein
MYMHQPPGAARMHDRCAGRQRDEPVPPDRGSHPPPDPTPRPHPVLVAEHDGRIAEATWAVDRLADPATHPRPGMDRVTAPTPPPRRSILGHPERASRTRTLTVTVRRRVVLLMNASALTGVLGLAIAACEGGAPSAPTARPTEELPTPSITARSTGELPTLSITAPSRSAEPEESPSQPPRSSITLPARSGGEIPTQYPPPTPSSAAAPASANVSAPATTANPAGPTSPATSTLVSTAPSAAPSSTPASSWLWWLLGLLVLLAAVVLVLGSVRARRARKAWEGRLAAVVAETTWLAHELLPTVLSQDAVARRATWTAYRPRVEALLTSLNEVLASARQDRESSLDRLRAAVYELSHAMDAYAATPQLDDRESLGAVREAQRWIEQALRAIQRAPDSQSGERVS